MHFNRAKKYINFMYENKYIFNILDFSIEKYKQKIFTKIWKFLKNGCYLWDANQRTVSKPRVSQMLWPLDQQEWDEK